MPHMKLSVAALVVSVAGISTAQAAAPRKVGTAKSYGARFINPKEGQIFHPGETVSISLELDQEKKVGNGHSSRKKAIPPHKSLCSC
jgi:hypothetical protein